MAQEHEMNPSSDMGQEHEMEPSSVMGQEHEMDTSSDVGQEHGISPSSDIGQEHEMDPNSDMEQFHDTAEKHEMDQRSVMKEEYESDSSIEKLDMEDDCETDPKSVLEALLTTADETVQQPMIMFYPELYKPDVMCKLQAAAVKKDPTNILFLTDLYMEYVKVSDFRKQYDTAIALYNLVPDSAYFFWAVMSVVMQASRLVDKEKQLLLLAVAERMIVNLTKTGGRIQTYQEVQIYIMILEMQGKLKKALDIVEGQLGKKLQCIAIQQKKRLDLLIKLGQWKEANIIVKKMLKVDMDNWSLYMQYLDTVFHLIDEESSESGSDGEKPDRTDTDCVKFVCQLYEENFRQSVRVRGPFLAQLQLFIRLKARGINGAPYLGNIGAMMSMYFFNFGKKLCCLNDLKPYLDLLQPNEASQFLFRTLTIIQLEKGQIPMTRLQMLQYISRVFMIRYLGFHEALSYKSKLQLAADFMQYYHITVQLSTDVLLPADIQYSDSYALLVAYLLSDVWVETGLAVYLRDAIVVLEYVMSKNPSSFHIKLLLIRLYNTLGVSQAADKVYKLLKIEQLQLDSLGYLQCQPLLFTGQYQLASQLYDATIKFFAYSHKISLYLISSSFTYGSFPKVSELVGLHNRLNRSLHNSLIAVEKALLDIFHTPTFQDTLNYFKDADIKMIAKEKEQWGHFVDNRDFEVYWTVEPHHRQITPDMVKTSFSHEVCYLQYRTLLLRIIMELTRIHNNYVNRVLIPHSPENTSNVPSSDWNDNTPSRKFSDGIMEGEMQKIQHESHIDINDTKKLSDHDPRNVLKSLADELKFLNETFSKNLQPLYKVSVISPDESRIFAVMKSSYTQFVVHLLNIVIFLSSCDASTTSGTNLKIVCESMIMDASTSLEQEISNLSALVRTTNPAQLVQRRKILMSLTLIIEMACIATFICRVVKHIIAVKHINSRLMKKQNENENVNLASGESAENQEHIGDPAEQLIKVINISMHNLDGIIFTLEDEWKNIYLEGDNICCLLEKLELSSSEVSQNVNNVHSKFSESYISSLTEIHAVLKTKIKYLSELTKFM